MKKRNKFVILLLLLNLAGSTLSKGQTTLSDKTFNYLAEQSIEAKGLRQQNAILESLLLKADTVERNLRLNVGRLEGAIGKDTLIKNTYKATATKCAEEKHDIKKSNGRLWKVVFTTTSVAILEGVIIYFKVIKQL